MHPDKNDREGTEEETKWQQISSVRDCNPMNREVQRVTKTEQHAIAKRERSRRVEAGKRNHEGKWWLMPPDLSKKQRGSILL